jgi:hypothetical protein
MAYLLLAIGVLFSLGWAVGLVFTLRSDAPRNPVIPALGIAAFVAVTFTSITAVSETMDNPARLNAKTYDRIQDGMTAAEVEGLLGPAMASPDRKSLDLAGKGVALPGDIVARLKGPTVQKPSQPRSPSLSGVSPASATPRQGSVHQQPTVVTA